DSTVPTLSRNRYVNETSFPQNTLGQTLEAVGWKFEEPTDKNVLPRRFLSLYLYRNVDVNVILFKRLLLGTTRPMPFVDHGLPGLGFRVHGVFGQSSSVIGQRPDPAR